MVARKRKEKKREEKGKGGGGGKERKKYALNGGFLAGAPPDRSATGRNCNIVDIHGYCRDELSGYEVVKRMKYQTSFDGSCSR